MAKQVIRINESQLKRMISESVKRVLREDVESMDSRLYFDNPSKERRVIKEGDIDNYHWYITSYGNRPCFYIDLPDVHSVHYCREDEFWGEGSITDIVTPIVREVTYWKNGVLGVDFGHYGDFIYDPRRNMSQDGKKWTVEEIEKIIQKYVQQLKSMENDKKLAEYLQNIEYPTYDEDEYDVWDNWDEYIKADEEDWDYVDEYDDSDI